MITIQNFLETIDFQITDGSDYLWKCFGNHAYRLESWSGASNNTDLYSIGIIFDKNNQTVYQAEAHDYEKQISYRWTNPEFVQAYRDEVKEKLDSETVDVAYDDVKFTDLEEAKDWLTKARAIFLNEPYDTRISIPIDLEDDELFRLMKLAHEQDITLNQLIEQILQRVIDKELDKCEV